LHVARADGSYVRLLAKIARMDVLIVDDWAMRNLKDQERHDFWEVIEDRTGQTSTIITSPDPSNKWHDYMADPNGRRCRLRPPLAQCPPDRAKGSFTKKGGALRKVTPASLRSDRHGVV